MSFFSLYCKGGEYHGYYCLPVPSSQKVLLHVQTDPLHRVMNNKQLPMVNGRQDDGTQRRHNRKPFKTDRISKTTNNKITPRELNQAENERISDIIDRQRCRYGAAGDQLLLILLLYRNTRQLEEWREEAKRQRQHSNNVGECCSNPVKALQQRGIHLTLNSFKTQDYRVCTIWE